MYQCAGCGSAACCEGEDGPFPESCPTRDLDRDAAIGAYSAGDGELARHAARVEARGYGRLTRVEEIMDFARRCGFSRLGVAHCIDLRREAAVVRRVFEANGFEAVSVACKAGALPKEALGLTNAEKVAPGEVDSMCKPIGQARLLADAETELNVLLGLCVGHDSHVLLQALRGARAPCWRPRTGCCGHNPLAAIYGADRVLSRQAVPGTE